MNMSGPAIDPSLAHFSWRPRGLLDLVELEKADRRIDQHGSPFPRIGQPSIETGAKGRIVGHALELCVRPVASPDEPVDAEVVAEQRDRGPGDPLPGISLSVPVRTGQLDPEPPGASRGQQVAKTRVIDAERGIGLAKMVRYDVHTRVQQGPQEGGPS